MPAPSPHSQVSIELKDLKLTQCLDKATRESLARQIFGDARYDDRARQGLDRYFQYYAAEIARAMVHKEKLCANLMHQELVDLVRMVLRAENLTDMIAALQVECESRTLPVSHEGLKHAIELAGRLASMHQIGSWRYHISRDEHLINWDDDSLAQCLDDYHAPAPNRNDFANCYLSRLDVTGLEKIAGFEIVWTNNLAEHLYLHGRDGTKRRKLSVFHNATYLLLSKDNTQVMLFPPNFILETLETLALLFGHNDSKTQKWLRRKAAETGLSLDEAVLSCGRLKDDSRQLDHFRFWRERLGILKEAFDEAKPNSWSRWYHDTRDPVQRTTFWTAVIVVGLTLLFGLIQSIEGGLQVWKAYNPSPTPS